MTSNIVNVSVVWRHENDVNKQFIDRFLDLGVKMLLLMNVFNEIAVVFAKLPILKAHFHSRKISTDRKFSQNIIVKS
jgi:hypothetical protein